MSTTSKDQDRTPYTIDEVAKLFRISRNLAYDQAKAGTFPTIQLGKRIFAPRAAIDRILEVGNKAAA